MTAPHPLPAPLAQLAGRHIESLQQALTRAGHPPLPELLQQSPAPVSWEVFERQLHLLLATSEFVAQTCIRQPDCLAQLITSGDLFTPQSESDLQELATRLAGAEDDSALDRQLRQARNRAMVRIIWRDFTRLAGTEETTAELSRLADTLIHASLNWHYRALTARFGEPRGQRSGRTQPMIVLGMGKLGALELNVSSDIDLIFAYPEAGETHR